jgi:hypothetical protein
MLKYSLIIFIFMLSFSTAQAAPEQIPVPNTVTMLDLGAKSCVPCKMMAPIIENSVCTTMERQLYDLLMYGKMKVLLGNTV